MSMIVIGVTGGIAAGKSFVTRELARLGAAVLDADRLGHAVLRLEEVKVAIWRRWGIVVFSPSVGEAESSSYEQEASEANADLTRWRVERSAVARRVFAPPPDGPRELAFLESLTHPLIGVLLQRRLARWAGSGRFLAAVLDAPVLYKAGWDVHCDTILFVDAPWEVRLRRAADRGWSSRELRARQARQPNLALQRRRADVIIDNGGGVMETTEQIERFWEALHDSANK